MDNGNAIVDADVEDQERGGRDGKLSVYSCPECGGALWQVDDEGVVRFVCYTKHEWTADTLLVAMSHMLRQAISEAVRRLEERAILLRQLSMTIDQRSEAAAQLIEEADQHQEHARLLRSQLLLEREPEPSIDTTADVLAEVARMTRRRADD